MDHFAGLDVSVKEMSVCIVDDTGRIAREVKVASEPDSLLQVLTNPAYHFKRIGLEAGPLSHFRGVPAYCAAPCHVALPAANDLAYAIELTDAGGWYGGEIRKTCPTFTTTRYVAPRAAGSGTREERDRLLAEAEVILGGWPFPLDLRARAPRLKWFHQRPAGASNLLAGDL